MRDDSFAARRRHLGRGDRTAVAVLVGAPLLVFVLPALAGYPLLTGDSVIQNFPLRALVGEMLRHGQAPVYDPFAWSGSALLGGINAGAAFPLVVLFVVLPPLAAWVATDVVAFAAAALGIYCFLRLERLRPLSSALGGAAFGLLGFTSSQAVHIDVVETCACLAWTLVAFERIARTRGATRVGWIVVAALAIACLGLAGSPEVAFYSAFGLLVYAGHLLVQASGERWSLAGALALASLTGVLLAGVQILPGAEVVLSSQRADIGAAFLTAGSLDGAQLLTLLAPHLLGGGPVGLRPYVGSYNLAEIDAYPGVLALVAATSLATRWRCADAARWRVWYLVAGLGLLIGLGKATPLPHLLAHLPIVGSSRLPSRALVLFALGLSILLAHWADDMLGEGGEPRATPCPTKRQPGPESRRLARWAGTVAPLAILALLGIVAVGGRAVARSLAGGSVGSWSVGRVAPYLVLAALVTAGAGVLALRGALWPARRRVVLLLVVAVADALLFTADQSSLAPVYARALGQPNALSAALSRLVGPGGRFVVFDPARSGGVALDEIGAPDLNGLAGVASAQGYGSLVWGPYAAATGTHGQDVVAPAAVGGHVLDSLDVRVLLAPSASFEQAIGSGASDTTAGAALPLSTGSTSTRYFGAVQHVETVTLRLLDTARGSGGELTRLASRLRLVTSSGRVVRATLRVTVRGATAVASFAGAPAAAGLALADPAGSGISRIDASVGLANGRRVALTGPLASVATPPHWRLDGSLGPYAVLLDERAAAPYLLEPVGRQSARGSVRVVAESPWQTSETFAVDARRPVRLLRSVADIPGWSAQLVRGRTSSPLRIRRDGLVQEVTVPAGKEEVTFAYDPPGIGAGIGASAVGLAILVATALFALGSARRDSVGRDRGGTDSSRGSRARRSSSRARPTGARRGICV